MACVTAAALAAASQASRARRANADRPARRDRTDWRGRGLGAALEPPGRQLRRRLGGQLRPVRHRRADRGRAAVARPVAVDHRSRAPAARRVLHADAVCHRRHDAHGDGIRPARDLSRPRGAVAGGLCADRLAPGLARGERGGVQVLPARRVRERVLSLRHCLHLRSDGQHAARSGRQPHGRAGAGTLADAAARRRPGARRICVQSVRRPVPHVDPRCVRSGADRSHGFHVDRRESAHSRRCARIPLGVQGPCRDQMGRSHRTSCRGHDDPRQNVIVVQSASSACSYSSIAHGGSISAGSFLSAKTSAKERCSFICCRMR